MNLLAWVGLAAAAWIAIGVLVFCIREREARQAIGEFLLALVVGPALVTVGVFLRHRAPRAMPLSPTALERFAKQLGPGSRSAWLLGYRGRGLIIVRRTDGVDWLNDLPNRASRVRREARKPRG